MTRALFFTAALFLAAFFALPPFVARAAVLEIQPLYFGEWIVRNNNAAHSINVTHTGVYGADPGFIEIQGATNGIYQISGLPSNGVLLSITVNQVTPLAGGGGPVFNMDNFTTQAANPDVNGITTLYIGARATTTGDSTPYPDDTYSGVLQVDFNF